MRSGIKTNRTLRVAEQDDETEKITFLAHISHGIRTPLNAIMGFSKLLNLNNTSYNNQKRYIKEILKGSDLLLQFVDNIIDLAYFENETYTINATEFDINQFIWDFVEAFYDKKFEEKISDINVMLVWESDVKDLKVCTDAYLLKKAMQLLFNIVTCRFPNKNYELGYAVEDSDYIRIFIRPSEDETADTDENKSYYLYEADQNNSFELFNHQVLTQCINFLNGELSLFSENREYWFKIPITI